MVGVPENSLLPNRLFPSLIGRFPSLMGRRHECLSGANSLENRPLRKGPQRGFRCATSLVVSKKLLLAFGAEKKHDSHRRDRI